MTQIDRRGDGQLVAEQFPAAVLQRCDLCIATHADVGLHVVPLPVIGQVVGIEQQIWRGVDQEAAHDIVGAASAATQIATGQR